MHTKVKGNIGEAAIALDLMKKGFSVFTEMGDNSRIDLIGIKDSKVLRFQVKCKDSKDGKVCVSLRKNAKGYDFSYSSDDFDYFGIYVIDLDLVCYVPLQMFFDLNITSALTLRIDESKNKQIKNIRRIEDFVDLPMA